ncbi:thermonuclease family protein [Roseibium sp.]|uniref:thermonuclease family protein n=1 Tax=Roseibium sp. TaxID=1936156 RepID=UPI003B5001A0
MLRCSARFAIVVLLIIAFAPLLEAATIVDGDTLIVRGVTYRLEGIDAPEHAQLCNLPSGKEWACGKQATDLLTSMIGDHEVRCEGTDNDGYGRVIGTCFLGALNLNREMVLSGMAWAFVKYSNAYVEEERVAKSAKLGVWQAPSKPAWVFREEKWNSSSQIAPEGCPIKGNISRNGRIYHAPWSPWYSRTKINLSKGERWFCSEAEAIEAGWRAPHWGR